MIDVNDLSLRFDANKQTLQISHVEYLCLLRLFQTCTLYSISSLSSAFFCAKSWRWTLDIVADSLESHTFL